jgi:hypothetical protein
MIVVQQATFCLPTKGDENPAGIELTFVVGEDGEQEIIFSDDNGVVVMTLSIGEMERMLEAVAEMIRNVKRSL